MWRKHLEVVVSARRNCLRLFRAKKPHLQWLCRRVILTSDTVWPFWFGFLFSILTANFKELSEFMEKKVVLASKCYSTASKKLLDSFFQDASQSFVTVKPRMTNKILKWPKIFAIWPLLLLDSSSRQDFCFLEFRSDAQFFFWRVLFAHCCCLFIFWPPHLTFLLS